MLSEISITMLSEISNTMLSEISITMLSEISNKVKQKCDHGDILFLVDVTKQSIVLAKQTIFIFKKKLIKHTSVVLETVGEIRRTILLGCMTAIVSERMCLCM